jgi:hypothetical protein
MNVNNLSGGAFITKKALIIQEMDSGEVFITGEVNLGEDSILKSHFFDEDKKVKIDSIDTLHNYIRRTG